MPALTLSQFLEQCRAAELALEQPCAPSAKEQALLRLETLATALGDARFSDGETKEAVEALLSLRVKGSTAFRLERLKLNLARSFERVKNREQGGPARRLDVTF